MSRLRIEFISTGDEVLTGEIDDTNASWVSRFLLDQGLVLSRRHTVADDLQELVALFKECAERADIVIVNGGLGPTEDDLSSEALAAALGEPRVMFNDWVEQMRQKYQRINRPMSEANLKQALLPKSAEVIDNPVGTACGFSAQLKRARFYFTPGVPHEFKRMMIEPVWGDISVRFALDKPRKVERFYTFGFAESDLVAFLQPLELPEQIHLGYRACMPLIEIKLTGEVGSLLEQKSAQLRQLLGDRLLFEGESSLAAAIQQKMIAANKKLALAESCTGGLIASSLVAEAGSSAYFERGFVTYCNAAKSQQLGVDKALLERAGAVSEAVAQAMAEGALRHSQADIALSVTGVAGPGGDVSPAGTELPAGRVIFALAIKGESTEVIRCQFRYRSRNQVRAMAATFALDMLRRYLSGFPVRGELDYIL